jgi:hypothetical protein
MLAGKNDRQALGGLVRVQAVASAIFVVSLLTGTAARSQVRSVFVTPIANAPFMAVVTEQRTTRQPDGTTVNLKSFHAIARNSAGVIYNENRPLVPVGFAGDPPVNSSHVYDPQTRLNTFIYPQLKSYEQHHLARPPAVVPPALNAVPEASALPDSQFAQQKDLGNKTMEGVTVHGVQVTQKVEDVTVTDEYWYSSDLRLNMLIKHDDPRSGSATITVTQVSRTEPAEGIFQIPQGYVLQGTP